MNNDILLSQHKDIVFIYARSISWAKGQADSYCWDKRNLFSTVKSVITVKSFCWKNHFNYFCSINQNVDSTSSYF